MIKGSSSTGYIAIIFILIIIIMLFAGWFGGPIQRGLRM